jgi:hypothetical protein
MSALADVIIVTLLAVISCMVTYVAHVMVKHDGIQGTLPGYLAIAACPVASVVSILTYIVSDSAWYSYFAWLVFFVPMWLIATIAACRNKTTG